jgi:hypothetical protein
VLQPIAVAASAVAADAHAEVILLTAAAASPALQQAFGLQSQTLAGTRNATNGWSAAQEAV